jgi:hypothetical protein
VLNETKISQDLLDAIEKIRLQLIARISKGNFKQVDIVQMAGQIDFFKELQSLGYGNLLEDYFKNYETVILDIKKQADRLGINVGASVRDLDAYINVRFDELLGRANQYGKELKSELLKHIISGTPNEQIALSLTEIPLTDNQLRVAVNTGIAQFERIGTAKIFEDAPETRYRLEGPDDERTRETCKAVLDGQPTDGWTIQEIDEGAATAIAGDDYTFVDCGGFNCRHRFRVIEKDSADEFIKKNPEYFQ